MKKSVFALVCTLFWATMPSWVVAEDVPPPPDQGAYHYIELPPGGLEAFMQWHPFRVALISHHRGGPAPGFAENAIETMQNALRYGPGLMEVDVAQLADGTLILMHDDTLDRTTTGSGDVSRMSWDDIAALELVDGEGKKTGHKVPKLWDALRWAQGRALLTLDIKRGTDFQAVATMVQEAQAQDYSIAISYTLEQAIAFYKIAPWMMQTVTIRNQEELEAVLQSGINKRKIIAWTGTRLLPSSHYAALHEQGWRVIVGTLGNPAYSMDGEILRRGDNRRYLALYKAGADILATDRFWAVQNMIRNPNIFVFKRQDFYR